MGLLPDTQNCGLRMCRGCRNVSLLPRVSDPDMLPPQWTSDVYSVSIPLCLHGWVLSVSFIGMERQIGLQCRFSDIRKWFLISENRGIFWYQKNTLPAKSMEYFEAQWKHSYLTFWFAGNGLAPTKTKYCHFNAFLMHSVRGEKYNLQCPKSKLHKMIYGDLSFFNASHKISQGFHGIHYYIVNLWECYVCSVISY